jgi:hypothetical protein
MDEHTSRVYLQDCQRSAQQLAKMMDVRASANTFNGADITPEGHPFFFCFL